MIAVPERQQESPTTRDATKVISVVERLPSAKVTSTWQTVGGTASEHWNESVAGCGPGYPSQNPGQAVDPPHAVATTNSKAARERPGSV